MKNILRSHDLWDLVKNEFETATKGSKEEDEDLSVAQKIALRENITKDAKTLGFIWNVVSYDIIPRTANEKTAKST